MSIDVAGVAIEILTWGQVGQPGLLFLHGNTAHADWWAFIAPFFAKTHRVVALSFSGMGNSEWRSSYSVDLYAQETLTAASLGGLFDAASPPVIVAHSFGSVVALKALASRERIFSSLIIVDNCVRLPIPNVRTRLPSRAHRVYSERAEIEQRFDLRPQQRCANGYILRFLARTSIVRCTSDEERPGWSWKFDPFATDSRGFNHAAFVNAAIASPAAPLSFIWGDRSSLVTPDRIRDTRAGSPIGTRFVEMPDAGHHVMLDQPLGFVASLRSLLA